MPATVRRFGAAPSPANLTENQPNKTEISRFAASRQAWNLILWPSSCYTHPPQRKEQKHLIESAEKEVEPIILAANYVKAGIAQHPETGT